MECYYHRGPGSPVHRYVMGKESTIFEKQVVCRGAVPSGDGVKITEEDSLMGVMLPGLWSECCTHAA